MWSVLQFSFHAWFLFCVYIYFCKQYWKSVSIYCLFANCPRIFFIGKVSPCIFYWQSVPMHFSLAKCPHIFFILRIFLIVKHSSHTALKNFCSSLFFSPFSFLPFLFSLLCVFSSCSCYKLDMEDLGDIQASFCHLSMKTLMTQFHCYFLGC
jgi:hypothetical protein